MKKHKLFTTRATFLRRGVEGVNLKFKKYSGIVNLTLEFDQKKTNLIVINSIRSRSFQEFLCEVNFYQRDSQLEN